MSESSRIGEECSLDLQVHDFLDDIGALGAAILTFSLFGQASSVPSFPMIAGGTPVNANYRLQACIT